MKTIAKTIDPTSGKVIETPLDSAQLQELRDACSKQFYADGTPRIFDRLRARRKRKSPRPA